MYQEVRVIVGNFLELMNKSEIDSGKVIEMLFLLLHIFILQTNFSIIQPDK